MTTHHQSSAVERRRALAAWVARDIMPHEARVRGWLARHRALPEDVDELIQEAYCRLATLETIDHIQRPDAYFFSIARHLLLRRLRRQRIVPIDAIAEIDSHRDDSPTPERQMEGKSDYERMLQIMDTLPDRCRQIVKLRKVEGWSQKRIADHLNTTEKAVEKQIWLGVKAIRLAWTRDEQAIECYFDQAAPAAAKIQ